MNLPAPPLALVPAEQSFRLLVDSVQDYAIFLLDPHGTVVSWNEGARRIKGYEAAEIIGHSFETFYEPEAVASGWPQKELQHATALGRFEDEGLRVRKDGTRFWASVIITALRNPQGTLIGFAKVTRDLSERRAQEEALRRSEEQLKLLIDSVRDCAIVMLDPSGVVLSWNTAAESITGYAAIEAIGHDHAMFFGASDVAAGKPAAELHRARLEGRSESQGWCVRKDGSAFWAGTAITPMLDPLGALRGFALVTRDLTDQRRLLELEQATRRTHEFLAVLGHELRNPLAPIRNAVSIMQLHPQMPAALTGPRDVIDRQLQQLTRLVDDLLDAARIFAGKIQLQLGRIDFREVVKASLEAIQASADKRRQVLHASVPAAPVWVHGDASRLIQALHNVLDNAVKFTPEEGNIRVETRIAGASCVTTVNDSGRGIAGDKLERIFQMFVQEDSEAGSPRTSGLGIGLNLARSLLERQGGRLTAHSAGVGQGSKFTMLMPLAADSHTRGASGPLTAGDRNRRSLPVLVVDDNQDSADTMVRLLTLLGHHAQGAYSAAEAHAAARQLRPLLVFLDLNLPDGNGFDLLQQMAPELPNGAVFAAMTGYGQAADRSKTLAAGFALHLVKPVGVGDVNDALEEARRRLDAAAQGT
ncbi:PAS domain-containing hybrid sensor histidine kinase/response regulator [Aquabacterium sp.]|uniref:PAS domain-containing hybrid sensor histidine kinase/response regulator n=1 Tax=Aquabacterium sp. TaxID=1872578 RepID=UPI002C6ED339|nr:PAS domain S-box protein [Aquabacterium sp.]HSW04302.1 PAS domain S-box protein [Aquabacterium sp.]